MLSPCLSEQPYAPARRPDGQEAMDLGGVHLERVAGLVKSDEADCPERVVAFGGACVALAAADGLELGLELG